MTGPRVTPIKSRLSAEDLLLCLLSLATGPILWWLSRSWQSLSAATSGQTLEYWIALVCGFGCIALSVLWILFLLAGVGMIVGLKTRNAALAYWAEVFTPKFLRRLIISVVGLQVAVAPQAFALPSEHESTEAPYVEDHQPFMPEVYDPQADPTESESPTDGLVPDASPTSADTETPSPAVEPRQFSEATITPTPEASPSLAEDVDPTPRQTSTIELEHEPESQTQTDPQLQQPRNRFTPQQPIPSPYIAAPQPTRNTEDPTVVIKTGDCLWDIAHNELGADATLFQIDQRWRQWWEHNRAVIGEDPHVLSPGTVLKAPPFTS